MRGLGLSLGLSRRVLGAVAGGLTQIYADVNGAFTSWSLNAMTAIQGITSNPEDGGNAADVREASTTGTHDITHAVSFVSGKTYRIRLLIRPDNENMIIVTVSVDSATKYWIGDYTTGVGALVNGFSNPQSANAGGWYVFSVDVSVVAAGGSPTLTIGVAKPGPTTNFTGTSTDGFRLGSVRIYQVGP